MGYRRRIVASLLGVSVAAGLLVAVSFAGNGASAETGGNFIATGHDLDFHCSSSGGTTTAECDYLKIVVDKVRNGSALPILALDQGAEVANALTNAGESPVTTVDPANTAAFNATPFTGAGDVPLYSAIITASDVTCGGCDNTAEGEANINARASDFATFFNHGGGILALAGAEARDTYYNFVPLGGLAATAVAPPFTVTPAGAALGITTEMANCCVTHNSFTTPPSPLQVLETDNSGNAETIGAFNVIINPCEGTTTTTIAGNCGFDTTSTSASSSSSSTSSSTTTTAPTSLVTSKVGAPEPVTAGNDVQYTVTVSNNGGSPVSGVQVTDNLPPGTTFVSASPGCTGTGPVTCSLGTINGSSSKSVNIVVNTPPNSGGQTFVNSATTTPGGSTATFTTHVTPATGHSAAGFVPPGGSITTGGDDPATLTLPPSGPGAVVTLNQVNGATFCNGTCAGPATFVNNFTGYNDPHQPIDLKLTFSARNRGQAESDLKTAKVYKLIDDPSSPQFGKVIVVPDCNDDPSWTAAQKKAAAQRRAQGFGTQSHIANPHPCVDSRSISQRPDGVWQTTFEILYLSGDGGWARR